MRKNDDALRCAGELNSAWHNGVGGQEMLTAEEHLIRLVAENEALQARLQEAALQAVTAFDQAQEAHERAEAQDALLRQAKEALIYHTQQTRPIVASQVAIHAIRQHLEGKA